MGFRVSTPSVIPFGQLLFKFKFSPWFPWDCSVSQNSWCHEMLSHMASREKTRKLVLWLVLTNLVACAIVILVCRSTPMEMSISLLEIMFTILPANTHYCIVLASPYYHGALSKVCLDNILQHQHNIYGSDRYRDIYPSHPSTHQGIYQPQ